MGIGSFISAVGGDVLGAGIQGWFNSREASKNRDFQASMSNTAYQRAAQDLEKAGLNRILALGNPASSPGGSAASMAAPALGSTGTAARLASANIASAKQSVEESKARERLATKDLDVRDATIKQLSAQTLRELEQARLIKTDADRGEATRALYPVLEDFLKSVLDGNPDVGKDAGEWFKGLFGIGNPARQRPKPSPGTPPGGQRQYRRR